MTEQRDKIWRKSAAEIQFRTQEVGGVRVTTSYHGSGHYLLSVETVGRPCIQTSFHIDGETWDMIAEMMTTARGNAVYYAGDDANSEVQP
jgi:hypothetical protein